MKRPLRLRVIFIQALIATLGSLYLGFFGDPVENFFTGQLFNRDNGFSVCDLCRYARILMYPLVLISGVALIRGDRQVIRYMFPSVILWLILEILHYTAQMVPWFDIGATCTAANPCMAFYVQYFGFLTIPGLCLLAFLIIFGAMLIGRQSNKRVSFNPDMQTDADKA